MFFSKQAGIIALDIDGTVTSNTDALDFQVIQALQTLASQQWKFIFLTGRPFQWGFRTLQFLPFSYALAVQNGALLLELPSRKILSRKYLPIESLPEIELICKTYQTDFVIYTGFEHADVCYFRPNQLPPSVLAYVQQRATYLEETWCPLESFSQLPMRSFAAVKCFVKEEQAFSLSQAFEQLGLHAPPIRDPFNSTYFVIQATHAEATKGDMLREFITLSEISGPIVAAGDDYNDRSMLQMADYKIVMANAPSEILALADVIAPPATQLGIIQGLAEAMQRIHQEGFNEE